MSAVSRVLLVLFLVLGPLRSLAWSQGDPPPRGFSLPFGGGDLLLDGPVHIDADTLTYDEEKGEFLAEGNVEVALGPRKMRADRIRYESRTGEAELEGKVRYKDADEAFSFDRIQINLGSETGVLYNGSILIARNNYRIAGERIEKTGEQSFRVEKGSLTTCPCDPEPDWEFSVRRSRIVIDGYAVSKDITFRVRGVPVFWLPYGVFPVKLSRQSGFLIPSFSSSKSRGFTFSLPFYWAINRWSDATLTMEMMSRRGYRPEAEFRYVPNGESEGTILGSFFRDKKDHEDRWRISGTNVYHSGDWTANAKVEVASDNQYYVDFAETDQLRSARHTLSRGFVGNSGDDVSQQLSIAWYREIEEFSKDNTLQRLPEYQASLLPMRTPLAGVEVSGEMAMTFFHREEGEDAQRGRGTITLSRTFVPYASISLTPYVSANLLGTRYRDLDQDRDTAGSAVPAAGVKLSAEAQRSYGGATGFVHVVGSELEYRQVFSVEQSDLPVLDRWSRLAPQDQFIFTVTQRFLRLSEEGSPREVASMHVEWAYDVNGRNPEETPYLDPLSPYTRTLGDQIDLGVGNTLRNDAASYLYGRLLVKPIGHWSVDGEALYDPDRGDFAMGAVGAGWEKDDDHKIKLGYRVTRELAEDVRTVFAWRPIRFLRLQGDLNYSLKNSEITEGSAGFMLMPKSDCWSVGFVTVWNTHPDDTSYRLVFSLKGIGSVGGN